MSAFHWGKRSLAHLETLGPDIQAILHRLIEITPQDLTIVSSLRTMGEQRAILARGASRTLNSRHLTGDAVDVAPWLPGEGIPWKDLEAFRVLGSSFLEAADMEKKLIQWGADWDMDGDTADESFLDFGHFQTPWSYNIPKARLAQERRTKARLLDSVVKFPTRETMDAEIRRLVRECSAA